MTHALGIDVGSVAVKVALLEKSGRLHGVWSRLIQGHPSEALTALLARVPAPLQVGAVRIGITGSGRDLARGRYHVEGSQRPVLEAFLHQVKAHARRHAAAASRAAIETSSRALLAAAGSPP